jgi:hypothetical protein
VSIGAAEYRLPAPFEASHRDMLRRPTSKECALQRQEQNRSVRPGIREWIAVARERSIVQRARKYAVVVGAILITINHGDAILAGDVDPRRLLKMCLTVLVPYTVSTLSSVGATLAFRAELARRETSRNA